MSLKYWVKEIKESRFSKVEHVLMRYNERAGGGGLDNAHFELWCALQRARELLKRDLVGDTVESEIDDFLNETEPPKQ